MSYQVDSNKPLNNDRQSHIMTESRKSGQKLKRTLSGSNESSTSRRKRLRKQTKADFQNFFVKMNGAVRVQRHDLSSSQVICTDIDDRKKNIDWWDQQGKTQTTNFPARTYKRSATPFRTNKQKQDYQKQSLSNIVSGSNISLSDQKDLQDQLNKDVIIAELENECHRLQSEFNRISNEASQLEQHNQQLSQTVAKLELQNKQLQDQLQSRLPKLSNQLLNQADILPEKSKKLVLLKKSIRQTRRAQQQADKQTILQQLTELRSANQQMRNEITELNQQLQFKRCIVRNYENAASLPTARQQLLNQQIRSLREQMNVLNNNLHIKFEEENRDLRQRNMALEVQLGKLFIKIRCLDKIHFKQKQLLCKQKQAQIAIAKEKLHTFMKDYEKFRKSYNEVRAENSMLKRPSKIDKTDNRLDQSIDYELSPE